MSEYPEKHLEIKTSLAGDWIDITADLILDSDKYDRGIFDTSPLARIEKSGGLTFGLCNSAENSVGIENYYTPGHINCMPGFAVGNRVRIRYYYNGEWRTDYKGIIPKKGIEPKGAPYGLNTVKVTAFNFMYSAVNAPVIITDVGQNGTLGDLVAGVIDQMDIKPDSINYRGLAEIFPTYFDQIKTNTTAAGEMLKGSLSEMGYIYSNYGVNDQDEILVVEGRNYRTAVLPRTSVPQHNRFLSRIVDESGNYPCDFNGDWILGAEEVSISTIPGITDRQIVTADNYINQMTGKCYPKHVGTSNELLFNLDSPLQLDAGASQTFYVTWKDPDNLATSVCRASIVQPIVGTDALLNSLGDGTGTVLNADLTAVVDDDTKGGSVTVTNIGLTNGFLTQLKIYGIAIKSYNPIEYVADAPDAQFDVNGIIPLTLDQRYITDPIKTKNFVDLIVLRLNIPNKNVFQWFEIWPSHSVANAGMLMYWDIGDRVPLSDADMNINEDYIIQGIKTDSENGLIRRRYYVKPLVLDTYIFWQLGVPGRSELGSSCILGFEL